MSYSSTLPIYIGYEVREHRAWDVCSFSIKVNHEDYLSPSYRGSPDIDVRKLRSQDIPEYDRNLGEPQSTDFTFTRFWVPYLTGFKGKAIFVDCDFLFLDDIGKLAKYADDHAVAVVKHPAYEPHTEIKMDGISQHRSYRKNWASLMVFNCEHPSNQILKPEYLNTHKPGLDFHHLSWLRDEEINSIPLEWNCLDGYYHIEEPRAIHYTDGGPWFENYKQTRYSDEWLKYESFETNARLESALKNE